MSLVTREAILAILEKGGGIRSTPPLIEDKAEFIERVTAICEQEKCGVPALIYA